jgi:hypothetical protein
MATVNTIKYVLYDQVIPDGALPVIECTSDGVAYGTIEIKLPLTACAITAKMYALTAPTTSSGPLWTRTGSELYYLYPQTLHWTSLQMSTGHYKITWEMDPSSLPGIASGQFYSIEFSVNAVDSAAVAQAYPKLIVKIKDIIV